MLTVTPIPAFKDNYIWALHDDKYAVIVDPGDAKPVNDFLLKRQLSLTAILATHHHDDHVGGIAELLSKQPVPVYGPRRENIPTLTRKLDENDQIEISALNLNFLVLDIPGHTAGHIAYYGNEMVFCGDTLFACGCGRLFEGTPAQMLDSLNKLAALPETTQVYCGHEYTIANLKFALAVEPDSSAIQQREVEESKKRKLDRPTLPTTIGLELKTNPFLRSNVLEVIKAASKHVDRRLDNDSLAVFTAIREWKNQF